MSRKKIVPILMFIVLLLVPTTVLAVDFEISEVRIDAHLTENGDASVVEKHTYVFDSKFNGITRDLLVKEGTSITDFEAFENGKSLKVEREKGTYKVFRSGKKETVVVEMHYRIVNAVEKYTDGAQFYWSFFDKHNETDYENMTIVIHPPAPAKEVQYVGYDTAYEKGTVSADGKVSFAMGKVPEGKNGDVRVIYEPELFTSATVNEGKIRDEVKAEINRLESEKETFIERQGIVKKYGFFAMTGFGLVLVGLLGFVFTLSHRKKQDVKGLLNDSLIPPERLSIPATIYYTNYEALSAEATSAALLDLVRKGYVKQLSDDEFELIDRAVDYPHEAALIELLFDKVGDGTSFHITNLETYTKKEKNHEAYGESLAKWQTAIVEEVKVAKLRENRSLLRWAVAILSSVVFIPVIIQFGYYELYPYMTITIFIAIIGLAFAAFYNPRNVKGLVLLLEWKEFRKRFAELDLNEWEKLSADDKFRAYTYGIGMKDKSLGHHFDEFRNAEKRLTSSNSGVGNFNPIFITSSFDSANANATVDAGGTSTSSSSSGGGVGGSGGGSGAF